MPTAEVRGISVQYEWAGRQAAPVVVLCSSLGTTLALWEPQMAAFAEQFRVLRYDMRGHGGSTASPGPYSIEILGQDLLGLLDALGVTTASLCGISIGGVIGQWLAVASPDRFDRMVFCNTAAKIGSVEGWNQRIEQVRRDGMPAIADAVLARWFTDEFTQSHPRTIEEMQRMLLDCDPEGYIAACAAIRDMDLRAQASVIRLPVCILSGAYDPVTPTQDAKWLNAQIIDSQLVQLPASHIANVEASAEFNSAVLQFFGVKDDRRRTP